MVQWVEHVQLKLLGGVVGWAIPTTWKAVFAVCPTSCSALMGGCKERFTRGSAVYLPPVQAGVCRGLVMPWTTAWLYFTNF